MKLESENSEVHYVKDELVFVSQIDFALLKTYAKKSNRQRARYCMHANKQSDLHEMFEVFTADTYLRPLKQIEKVYSYHVIFGHMDIYLFTDSGDVMNKISLGDYQSKKPFYFRAPINTYRTLVTTSEAVLYHEVTTGPFKKTETLFAPWAPSEEDSVGIKEFIERLKRYQKNKDDNVGDYLSA